MAMPSLRSPPSQAEFDVAQHGQRVCCKDIVAVAGQATQTRFTA